MRPILPTRRRCEPDGKQYFTLKQIALDEGVSQRTINRWIASFGCPVYDFTGNQPIFTADAVEQLKAKRLRALAQKTGLELEDARDGGIVSLKELRAIKRAGRNGHAKNGKARR